MCNHFYTHEIEKACPCPDLFKELNTPKVKKEFQSNLDYEVFWDLPFDSFGKCIFHSEDLQFKKVNKIITRFRSLVNVLNEIIKKKFIPNIEFMDFVGFIFSEETVKYSEDYETDIIDLTDLKFKQYCFFNHTNWKARVLFDYATFNYTAHFDDAVFEQMAEFKYVTFHQQLQFNRINFKGGISILDCNFNSILAEDTQISEGRIMGSEISNLALFRGIHAENLVWQDIDFQNDSSVTTLDFSGCRLKNVRFENCVFNSKADFNGSNFDQVEFVDVSFSSNLETNFDNIAVHNKLIFKSTNPEKKIFQFTINMNIQPEQIQGQIFFEQV